MARILDDGEIPVDVKFEEAVDGEPTFRRARPKRSPASERRSSPSPTLLRTQPPDPEKSGGFFLPDAFTNPEHIRYALKTTAAAMFCYVLYSLLDWPGIHTILITCYIVSLGTAAETIEKLTFRILGCLIGAASGIATIVYLIPYITSIGDLMASYFSAHSCRHGSRSEAHDCLCGVPIAFAFFFASSRARDLLRHGDGQGPSIGILLGNIVVYIFCSISNCPASIGQRVDRVTFAALLRTSGGAC